MSSTSNPVRFSVEIHGLAEVFTFENRDVFMQWKNEVDSLLEHYNQTNSMECFCDTCIFAVYLRSQEFLCKANEFVRRWSVGMVHTKLKAVIIRSEKALNLPENERLFSDQTAPCA